MNCDQFAGRWNEHVLGSLDARDESQMLDHSRACDACGTKWREQDELSVLLESVLSPLKPADDAAARLAARLPPAELPKRDAPAPAPAPVQQALPGQWGNLLLAALVGALAGYVLSIAGGANSPIEQLAAIEILRYGSGRGGLSDLTLAATDFRSLIIGAAILGWITRASFWEILYPASLPRGIVLARWVAMPTLLIGVLLLVLQLWSFVVTWNSAMIQGRTADLETLLATTQLLDQFWRIGFWLTLLTLLCSMLNEVITRHSRPLQ